MGKTKPYRDSTPESPPELIEDLGSNPFGNKPARLRKRGAVSIPPPPMSVFFDDEPKNSWDEAPGTPNFGRTENVSERSVPAEAVSDATVTNSGEGQEAERLALRRRSGAGEDIASATARQRLS